MRLHSIALRSVFDQVVELIDPSSRQGPNSPWCHYLRTWKALALVCHEWHHIAIPYLYHDIALCHVGQIPALARTLKKNAEFCGMIKRLTYSCFVPAEYDLVANQGLSYLLDHCSVLESLTFTSPFTEWIDGIREDGTKRFIIPEGPWGSVTHFTYNRGDPAVLVNRGQHKLSILPRQILTCLPNITSLTLIVDSPEKCEWDEKLLELTMMHLQQVCVQSFSCYTAFRKKFDPTKNGIRIEETLYPLVNGHALLLVPTATSIGSLQHVVIRHRYPHSISTNF
ncbi:hypothetical protein QCA50_007447 [Cerrena zonata]|uniref:F-box domain-containing protein n=1 Tax=Cerrena zonata TaxID=2478898 RepID=A0AAW0G8A1_9APHY